MNEAPFRILAVCGSLRKHSTNLGLLRAARDSAPEGVQVEIADLAAIPLYNGDVEAVGFPEPVADLQRRLREADALLIASPEYNHSISGVLKNTIDWLSRGPAPSPFHRKPVAITGASTGLVGTARAQYAERQVLAGLACYVMVEPTLLVSLNREKFDAEGNLTDELTRAGVAKLVAGLVAWARLTHP